MNNASASSMIAGKCGSALLPASWPASGIIEIVNRKGDRSLGKSIQSSSAGNVYIHGVDDTDAAGNKTWTLVTLAATTAGNLSGANEAPFIFDEIRQDGTDIDLSAITVWI